MFEALRRLLGNSNQSTQTLAAIREGIANQSNLINNKLDVLGNLSFSTQLLVEIRDGIANQSSLINDKIDILIDGQRSQVHELKNLQKRYDELINRK